jgi:DNA-binding transcriptional ArsR family regulator
MSANSSSEIEALSATFAALSDPTRRAMLTRLSQGEASVNELAAPFNMSLPAVSKHIKVLEKAGLLTKTRSAQQRPCKIDGVQLKQAVDWIDQFTINNIAKDAINTPATVKKTLKKQVKTVATPENVTKKPKFKLKITKTATQTDTQTKEKTNGNKDTDSDLQQQIGFDF